VPVDADDPADHVGGIMSIRPNPVALTVDSTHLDDVLWNNAAALYRIN
jgi:hypothetical protein